MKLIPLGVNGLCDCYDRHTACFLLLTDTHAIALDAGTGLSRLIESDFADLVKNYAELHIILTHYHLDHISGLFSLVTSWPSKPVILHVPDTSLITHPASAIVDYCSPPYIADRLSNIINLDIAEFGSTPLNIGRHRFTFHSNLHPGGCASLRLGNSLAYVTDTPIDQEIINFTRDVDLLLHECWLTDQQAEKNQQEATRHSYLSGLVQTAAAANVRRLMPIHLQPDRCAQYPRQLHQKLTARLAPYGIQTLEPTEGFSYDL